jgi:hypothetical protein
MHAQATPNFIHIHRRGGERFVIVFIHHLLVVLYFRIDGQSDQRRVRFHSILSFVGTFVTL